MTKINLLRAREVLAAPDLPWTAEVKAALAQAYIDHLQAIQTLTQRLNELERGAQ